MHQALQRIASNPVFSRLPPPLRERLVARAFLRHFDKGERLITEGDPAKWIWCLERGRLRVFHSSPAGQEVVIKVFHAPVLFGEAEALAGLAHLENVDAIEPSELVLLPVEDVLLVLRQHGDAAVAMLIDVSVRLAIAAQNEKSLAFDPVPRRLANYLLDYASWMNLPGAEPLQVALTQDEMAAAIGVTRRAIAKAVIAWQRQGIVGRAGRTYAILDRKALAEFADPEHRGLGYSLRRAKPSR